MLFRSEISTARLGAVTFHPGRGCGTASFNLPVSKNDVHALGKVRTHGCACAAGNSCPVLALRSLVEGSESFRGPSSPDALSSRPLCPTASGGFPTKEGMVKIFRRFGKELGVRDRITGHMPRVAGAVRLAKAGLEVWKIQMFCRWGRSVVLRYIQEAPLEQSHTWALEAASGLSLAAARHELIARYQQAQTGETERTPESELKLASEQAFRDLQKCLEVKLEGAEDRWSVLLRIFEEKLDAVAARVGAEMPKYVVNNGSASRKVHVVRNEVFTMCGWSWRGHGHSVSRQNLLQGDNECTKCRAFSGGGTPPLAGKGG